MITHSLSTLLQTTVTAYYDIRFNRDSSLETKSLLKELHLLLLSVVNGEPSFDARLENLRGLIASELNSMPEKAAAALLQDGVKGLMQGQIVPGAQGYLERLNDISMAQVLAAA